MSEHGSEDATQSFEYLGDEPVQPEQPTVRRGGKRALIGLTVAAVVVAGGAGAFAVAQFLDGGPSAATAAPANTMAFVSLDLDPSGGQKVAAYQTLKKFPALEKNLGLTSEEDLRRWVYEGLTSDTDCDTKSFDAVEPWLGNALGLGAVPGKDEPTVFFTLEVTDQDKAAPGAKSLADCLGEDEVGTAFAGDFMIVAETAAEARDIAQSAQESSLADDPTYQARTGAAGEDGVVTGYLAPSLGDYLAEQMNNMGGMFEGPVVESDSGSGEASLAGRAGPRLAETPEESPTPAPQNQVSEEAQPGEAPSDFPTELPSDFPTDFPTEQPSDFPTDFPEDEGEFDEMPMPLNPFMIGMPGLLFGGLGGMGGFEEMGDKLAEFQGAAMQVRFADESLEIEMVSKGLEGDIADEGSVDLRDLPEGTGLALGLATGEDWVDAMVERLRSADPEEFEAAMEEGSRETGLTLPQDLTTLAGDSISVAIDSSVDLPKVFESFFFAGDLGSTKAGVRIVGDPAEIAPIAQKLVDYASHEDGPQLVVGQGDDAVAIGFDQAYVDQLAEGGDLGDASSYGDAVPDGDDALGAAFADFDANGWLAKAMEDSSKDDKANAEPLSALGLTMTRDQDSLHATLRLTTD